MKKLAIATTLMCVTSAVFAGSPGVQGLDLFVGKSYLKAESGGDSVKPDGYDLGVRGTAAIANGLFVRGAYEHSDGDDSISGTKINAKIDEVRIGGGYSIDISPESKLYANAEYVNFDLKASASGFGSEKTSADGFAVGVGGSTDVSPLVNLYASAGYVSVKDEEKLTGGEFSLGAQYKAAEKTSVFAEYRYTGLDSDDVDYTFQSFRLGVRFTF